MASRITLLSILCIETGILLRVYAHPEIGSMFIGCSFSLFIISLIAAFRGFSMVRKQHRMQNPMELFPPITLAMQAQNKEILDRVIGELKQSTESDQLIEPIITLRKEINDVISEEKMKDGTAFTIDMDQVQNINERMQKFESNPKYSEFFAKAKKARCTACDSKDECSGNCA